MKLKRMLPAAAFALVLLVGWFFYQLLGPSPAIVVSRETTYLTEPLADDGLPDYAGWLLAKQREDVTPENNAAIPFLQAMWPANLEVQHQGVVCQAISMDVPTRPGLVEPDDYQSDHPVTLDIRLRLLASRGIEPEESITTKADFGAWTHRLNEGQTDNIDPLADDHAVRMPLPAADWSVFDYPEQEDSE